MASCLLAGFKPDQAPPCPDGIEAVGSNFASISYRKVVSVIVSIAWINATIATSAWGQDLPPLPIEDRAQAVECLTLAIAYEAGFEPVEGQQAVAEVILNRVRDPAFPKSVCNVVFAGSTRRTGCQFTFTCDGSMRRRLPESIFTRARAIAEQAIDGTIPPLVGDATNYHADYVSPYWAPSLERVAKIGLHVFYRRPGSVAATVGSGLSPTGISAPEASASKKSPPEPFAPWGLSPSPAAPSTRIDFKP